MKEKKGRGTGIGTLIPTWPTSISCLNFLADFPEAVKIEVPLPNGLLLIKGVMLLFIRKAEVDLLTKVVTA